MGKFHLRRYHHPGELGRDLGRLLERRKDIRPLMRGESLDPAFRERLMLAVTAVNQCRYCSYAHARMALREGLPEEQIAELLQGELQNCPPDEIHALLYAQAWAEANGLPDPLAREALQVHYRPQQIEAIELTIQVMRVANLIGNTFDYLFYRLSFGHLGSERVSLTDQKG